MQIDTSVLKEHLGSGGPWATEAGERIQQVREALRLSQEQVAADVGVTTTTIKSIEAGRLVPREYLRAAICGVLRRDVGDIWPPLRCERIRTMALNEAVA